MSPVMQQDAQSRAGAKAGLMAGSDDVDAPAAASPMNKRLAEQS